MQHDDRPATPTPPTNSFYLYRAWVLSTLDVVAVCSGITLASAIVTQSTLHLPDALALGTLTQLAVGGLAGLYSGRLKVATFTEVCRLSVTYLVSLVTVFALLSALGNSGLYWRQAVVAVLVAASLSVTARAVWRQWHARHSRPTRATRRVVVFGAGEAGEQVVKAMFNDSTGEYLPVALIDDNPHKTKRKILGVPMAGNRTALASVFHDYGADVLLIAMPSADGPTLRAIWDAASPYCEDIRTLPRVASLLGGRVTVGDIGPLTPDDVLGRRKITLDLGSIDSYVGGKRVLVTGAGGSIGGELCRQLALYGPETVIKLDRDESGLHATQLSIDGSGSVSDPSLVVADIRDRDRLFEVFDEFRPQVVFHAAALKHVPLLELHPAEGVKTNVIGTQNVLDACDHVGVERFVNISTDKAADPSNVLGQTKRIAETLTAHAGAGAEAGVDRRYLSVRFGNVLGSRGSMLETFAAQAARGGPITVTDPDVTRYFMTIAEAVQLTIQAGAIGDDGQVLILDMGEPMRIHDIARQFATRSIPPLDIVITGLRPGEKLHEVLLGAGEIDHRPVHPLISHVRVPPLDPWMLALAPLGNAIELRQWLASACLVSTVEA